MVKDLTTGSPIGLIVRFAIPLLIGNLFQQVYSTVDALVVGRALGVRALAAVGCTAPLLFLIIGFVMGLSAGFSIIISQRFGAKDWPGLRTGFCTSVLLGATAASIVTALSVPNAHALLSFMNTPPDILDDASTYLAISLTGLGAGLFFNIFSTTIMALGDSKTPLVFLGICCLVNTVLDLALILGLGQGVAGAAWATVFSQMVSALLCLAYILRRLPLVRPRACDWRQVSRGQLWGHLRMGLPMGFQSSLICIGIMMVQAALNTLGSEHVAAFTAAYRVDAIGIMPLMSFGLAVATYTGQNFGAGRISRIRKGVRQSAIAALIYAGVAAAVCIVAGEPMIRVFLGEGQEHVVRLGWQFLVIQSVMYWVLALLFVFRNALQGIGNSLVPTIAGFGELIMRAIAAFGLAGPLGYVGICVASPMAWVGSLVPLVIAYWLWVRSLRNKAPRERRAHAPVPAAE